MTIELKADCLDCNHPFKATLIGADKGDGKFYFISTFETKDEAEAWAKALIKEKKMDFCSYNIEENSGDIIISGVKDDIFASLKGEAQDEAEEDEEEPKPKLKPLNRKWYEIF